MGAAQRPDAVIPARVLRLPPTYLARFLVLYIILDHVFDVWRWWFFDGHASGCAST